MKKAELNRLRAAGWKVGGVREFLDLTDEDIALIELELAFADVICQPRQRRALTQIGRAKLIGASRSRVAKMEAGDASVSLDLMFRTAFGLGLSASEVSRRISKPLRSRGASKKAGREPRHEWPVPRRVEPTRRSPATRRRSVKVRWVRQRRTCVRSTASPAIPE